MNITFKFTPPPVEGKRKEANFKFYININDIDLWKLKRQEKKDFLKKQVVNKDGVN